MPAQPAMLLSQPWGGALASDTFSATHAFLSIPAVNTAYTGLVSGWCTESLSVTEATPTVSAASPERWFDIVATLNDSKSSSQPSSTGVPVSDDNVLGVVSSALRAALGDPQWEESGVTKLLADALDAAHVDPAMGRDAALRLLDFRDIVCRAQALRKASSAGTPADQTVFKAPPLGGAAKAQAEFRKAKRSRHRPVERALTPRPVFAGQTGSLARRTDASGMTHRKRPRFDHDAVNNDVSTSYDSAAKRFCSASGMTPCTTNSNPHDAPDSVYVELHRGCSTAADNLQFSQPHIVKWSGALKHRLNTSTATVCTLHAHVPETYGDQLPSTLYINEIVPRSKVYMGQHHTVRCSLGQLTAKQQQKLEMLAKAELVAIIQLQMCRLVMVPYFDKQQSIKLVGFLYDT